MEIEMMVIKGHIGTVPKEIKDPRQVLHLILMGLKRIHWLLFSPPLKPTKNERFSDNFRGDIRSLLIRISLLNIKGEI